MICRFFSSYFGAAQFTVYNFRCTKITVGRVMGAGGRDYFSLLDFNEA